MEAQTKMARHWPPAPIEVSQGSFPNYQINGINCATQGLTACRNTHLPTNHVDTEHG